VRQRDRRLRQKRAHAGEEAEEPPVRAAGNAARLISHSVIRQITHIPSTMLAARLIMSALCGMEFSPRVRPHRDPGQGGACLVLALSFLRSASALTLEQQCGRPAA
jgi:hypothetical protein